MKFGRIIRGLLMVLIIGCALVSEPITARADKRPEKTTGVECINAFTTSAQLSFNKAAGAKGYEIAIYDSQNKLVKKQYTQYTKVSVTELVPGGKYRATVRAYSWNFNGTRRYGAVSESVRFATIPSKITGINVSTATNSTVTLEWNYNERVTGYLVYKYNLDTKKWQFFKIITDNKLVAQDMKPGIEYRYVIKPYVYCAGKRFIGAGYEKKIMAQPADISGIDVVWQNYSSFRVKWDKAVGATGYRVALYDETGKCILYYHTANTAATFKDLDFTKKYKVIVRSYRLFANEKRIYGGYVSKNVYTKIGLVNNIVQTNASDISATISFDPVEGANLYNIYMYNKANGKKKLLTSIAETSYTIEGLKKNREYGIVVSARLVEENKTYYGELSQPVFVYTYPDGVTQYKVSDNTEIGFSVTWNEVPMAVYYSVYYKNEETGKYVFAGNVKNNSYRFDCFTNGTECYFAIVAVCRFGNETYTCPKLVGSGWTIENQLNLSAGYTKDGVYVISWKPSATATGYEVYTYDENSGKWIEVANTTESSYTYTLTDNKVHRFKVRAYNKTKTEILRGDFSDEVLINVGKHGIDVSKWQGEIDWKKVADSGIEFAIIKVGGRGYGQAGNMYEDPYFKANIEGALVNGIEVGIYFFSTSISEEEAIEEAKWTLDKIKDYDVTYPIIYDYEGYDDPKYRSYGQTRTARSNYAIAFLNYIRTNGYIPMMYASQYYYNTQWDTDRLSDYNLWVAKYPSGNNGQLMVGREPKIDYPYAMWQYSSTGKVDGIQASNGAYRNVDMNYQYTSFKK
ncbi:MAG: hypothetical protein IJD02_01430 [Lachnospiraceae bacterium]|nr:hypothetical protein [Lachnospiraceae bacterium]